MEMLIAKADNMLMISDLSVAILCDVMTQFKKRNVIRAIFSQGS